MTQDIDKLSSEDLGKLFPIRITEYNPDWPGLFTTEKETIQKFVGISNILRIEHIGSTAVPGLCAKPTIDILVEIKDETNIELIINNLKRADYHYISRPENPSPHMMFAKGYSDKGYIGQAYHIHVRYSGDWDEILFRDFLIRNPDIAREYEKLKLRLAGNYINDREKYTISKTEFITRINKKAKEELKNTDKS